MLEPRVRVTCQVYTDKDLGTPIVWKGLGVRGGREQYEESWMPKMQHVRHAMQGVPFVLCGSIVVIWRAPREHDEQ